MLTRNGPQPLGLSAPHSASASPASVGDGELLARFAEGDRTALEELFRRHRAAALRAAIRVLADCTAAEDAVQEGFLSAFANLTGFKSQSSFKTWLLAIVRRSALELGRKRGRQTKLIDRFSHDGRRLADERVASEEEQRVHALREAIDTILEEQATERMCLITQLRLQGRTHRQIAAEVGVSVETVKLDRRKIKSILRQELRRLGWSIP